MPHIAANGIQIYYESFGKGPPLLLIGGFVQHSPFWRECIPALSKHFHVIPFDNRGVGRTDAPAESYSIEMFAEDTVALMDALSIESANIMSVSMGTLITQQLCLTHPDRVNKVVLCAPFAHFPEIAAHNVRMQIKMLQSGIPRELLAELNMAWLLSNRFFANDENRAQYLKEILSDPYPITMEGLLGQADALLSADLREKIEKIPHEVLLLVGELDIDTPPYCARLIQDRIPNCKMHTFKEAPHLFIYEIPNQVTKQALEFLL